MTMKTPRIVPLSTLVVNILHTLQLVSGRQPNLCLRSGNAVAFLQHTLVHTAGLLLKIRSCCQLASPHRPVSQLQCTDGPSYCQANKMITSIFRRLGNLFRKRSSNTSSQPGALNTPLFLPEYSPPEKGRLPNFFYPVFWGTTDPEEVTKSLETVTKKLEGGYHFSDNLLTWCRNLSMFDDAPFMTAWRQNTESAADEAIVWRRYVLACAAYHCIHLEGDFVECGAYTGVGIKTVVDYMGGTEFPKIFWGYDLFEHDPTMLNHSMPEHGKDLYRRVCEKFTGYPQVRMVKGRIPEVFREHGGGPQKIAYLHIDLNQAPAEIASLEYLFDRMVPGGILILDDYEWAGIYRGQKLAEDAWFDERKYRVMPLPTGQGLIIKR